jgi:hypothetical protein
MPSTRLYKVRVERGLCVACGKLPPAQGLRRCDDCTQAYRAYQRVYHGSLPKQEGGPGRPLSPLAPPDQQPVRWPKWIERSRARYGLDRKEDRSA